MNSNYDPMINRDSSFETRLDSEILDHDEEEGQRLPLINVDAPPEKPVSKTNKS